MFCACVCEMIILELSVLLIKGTGGDGSVLKPT